MNGGAGKTRDNEATERIAEAWEPNRREESTEHIFLWLPDIII